MKIPTALVPLVVALGVVLRVFEPGSDERVIGLTAFGVLLIDLIEFLAGSGQ